MDFSELVNETLRAPSHPAQQDPERLHALIEQYGERNELHTHGLLQYQAVLKTRRNKPPTYYIHRLTPPRHPGEIPIRFLTRPTYGPTHGVAGAHAEHTTHAELINATHHRPLAARAARIALKIAPPGPVHLLCPSPSTPWLINGAPPTGSEEAELLNLLQRHPYPVTAELAAPTVTQLVQFPNNLLHSPNPFPETHAHLTHTHQDTHLHIQLGNLNLTTARHPYHPDGVHALITAAPHIPPRTRVHLNCTPTEHAALTDPTTVLGPDAHDLLLTLDHLRKQNVTLKLQLNRRRTTPP